LNSHLIVDVNLPLEMVHNTRYLLSKWLCHWVGTFNAVCYDPCEGGRSWSV